MSVLFGLLAFQLVFVVNQIHFPFETGIPGLAPANFLLILILLAMRGKTDTLESPGILRKPLLIFFGALTVAFLWGQVVAPGDLLADITYLKNGIAFPVFYLIYLRSGLDEKRTRQLVILVMVIAAVAGLEGIREGLDYGFGKYNQFRRASGPFGVDWHDANRAGVYYAMFAPMFIALALFLKGKLHWRVGAVGGIVLLCGGALFTYSRQAYAVILIAFALLLVRKSVIIAAVVSIALISSVSLLPDAVFQRVEETQQADQSGHEEVDESTASRWEIWAGALKMWSDNPMGVGLNHFKAGIGSYCKYKGMDAHNFYVLTFAEMGPLGLGSLLFLMWSLFKLARFLRKNAARGDPEMDALTVGFSVTTLAVCLGGIYGSPTLHPAVMGTYWALCGLMERLVLLKMRVGQEELSSRSPEPTIAERFPLAGSFYGPTHAPRRW